MNEVFLNMAGRNVSYIKPQTPSFIEKFKKKVGYQEAPSVETKFQKNESPFVEEPEREDEKPTVILGSNVSETEADAFLTERLREEKNADNQGGSTRCLNLFFKNQSYHLLTIK